MMKDKQFDCVKMKREIQQQIEKERVGLSDKEAHKAQMEKILENDIVGTFLKKIYSTNQLAVKV
ncbi:MAG: hypothetical protein D3916_00130 [Candidatus Electrothrix sp. MAN1_4]|nr:hypothetical protein [Candidatus Electrothrix sp. MAN1_4]